MVELDMARDKLADRRDVKWQEAMITELEGLWCANASDQVTSTMALFIGNIQ
jgi:hypothetical protein